MNLVIDQGNTQFKVGLFNNSELIDTFRFNYNNLDDFRSAVEHLSINKVIVSSVVKSVLDLSFIKSSKILYFSHSTKIPILNAYDTPTTLGLDRLANAIGAWRLNPKSNSLVIDLGTCIKYDIVSTKGEYLGGNISPGMQMRFKALNHFTDQLPLIAPKKDLNQLYGTDTESSLQCGVMHGISHEIKGFIQRYQKEFNQLTIFMTGGDSKYFDKRDKKSIFANQNLTLIGLNEILNHNA